MNENIDQVLSQELLDILRCPIAVQSKEFGDDPGQLELIHNCWLVCHDTNMKYPIRDGIPVMLIEEGEKWKSTSVNNLPVPPPNS
ncbi:MAG: Trm112 family protein [Chloroflexi bacterium]|nr:Trm112 family protein [Chloroflexota bacterium]